MAKICLAFLSAVAVMLIAATSQSEERYPFRLPEWLWADDERYSSLIDESERTKIQALLAEAAALKAANLDAAADTKESAATALINAQFSRRDLVRGAPVVRGGSFELALHLDPKFPTEIQPVLMEAVAIFLRLATREDIVAKAFAVAGDRPEPWPEKIRDGRLNPAWQLAMRSIVKPASVRSFIAEMDAVLKPTDPDLPLLVVSTYTGNVWWGGGIYDFYRASDVQLRRFGAQGFLYIRLNLDRMTPDSPQRLDPGFWASKIAHETLHNLGYWHPNYADPAERDRLNAGPQRAFLVAYEAAMFEAVGATK
ncbi:MAG: hypothetical protein GY873_18065 [Bosea sp.]|uniref:hypothetical protein n=1 Tax=Bosea sp. (in: a-proteobacteria) TaxID=1871050 RepID=UPI002385D15E|nr:hypothetical protein [Bosea sp. (in: a-proteobacteria)]MCP4736095.1 hypothetical protein [Bosea sp. (in: a-proteobacteria)]